MQKTLRGTKSTCFDSDQTEASSSADFPTRKHASRCHRREAKCRD